MRMVKIRVLLLATSCAVFATSQVTAQGLRTVRGTVLAARDSTPISGVSIRVIEFDIRAQSDQAGRFRLIDVPRSPTRVTFERLDAIADTVPLSASADSLVVYLRAEAVRIAPVTTTALPPARERFDRVAQTSTVTLDVIDITRAPAVLEADVLRIVQLLPGTVARNDFSTGFHVRGGEADQNLITLDGVTVFNPSHLGGLFSTFDASAVDRVEFLTGAFPAEYGGRLSSVLDVRLRNGSRDRTTVQGQLSLLSAKVLVDGPLGGRATYMVGARRTYADAVVGIFSKETLPYWFGDAVGKVAIAIGSGRLTATGYWGRDALDWPWVEAEPGRDPVDLEFSWGNRLAGLRFEQPFGRHTLELYASGSGFSTALGLEPAVVRVDNSVRLLSAGGAIAFNPDARHAVRIGAGVEDYDMRYEIQSDALTANFFSARYRPRIWSAFIDDQWNLFGWLLLRPGVRAEYVEGASANSAGADFRALSPRISIKTFLSHDLALIGSAGRYYQAIHSLRDEDIPFAVFDFWIGADDVTPVSRADHLVLGFEKWIGNEYSVSVEGYRKDFKDLVVRRVGEDFRVRGDEFVSTDGDAWGVDVLARKYQGSVRGWIAYGFTRAERRAAGEVFPPAHDRRHSFNIVLETAGPLGSDMGIHWGFGSPLPYRGFIGEWQHRQYSAILHAFEDFEEEPLAAAQRNGERYPSYNRLDVSFRWEVSKWGGILRPYFQIVNVYNRKNIFLYRFDFQDRPATRTGISQFPLCASFGVEFEF